MNNNYLDYSKLCTCGNYKPYSPSGIVAAIQPFGSCVNCYMHNIIKDNPKLVITDNVSLIDELKAEIDTMTPEEREVFLNGFWRASEDITPHLIKPKVDNKLTT